MIVPYALARPAVVTLGRTTLSLGLRIRAAAGSASAAPTDAASAVASIMRPSREETLPIFESLMSTRASRASRLTRPATLAAYALTFAES